MYNLTKNTGGGENMKKILKKRCKIPVNAIRYFSFENGQTYVSINTTTINTVNVCEEWCPSK